MKYNNIEETRVSFENAKLLKEVGFGVPCNEYYIEKDYAELLNDNRKSLHLPERFNEGDVHTQRNKKHRGRLINRNQYSTTTSRPTQQLAIDWIRVNFDIDIHYIKHGITKEYSPFISTDKQINQPLMNWFTTPEEAKEAAIKHVLENLIKKSQ